MLKAGMHISIPMKVSQLDQEGEFIWYDCSVVGYRFTHVVNRNTFPKWVKETIRYLLDNRIKNAYCWYTTEDDGVQALIFDDEASLEDILIYFIRNQFESQMESYRLGLLTALGLSNKVD